MLWHDMKKYRWVWNYAYPTEMNNLAALSLDLSYYCAFSVLKKKITGSSQVAEVLGFGLSLL